MPRFLPSASHASMAKSSAQRPARRATPANPPADNDAADLAAAKATLAALPAAALLTGDKWSGGGVEIHFANPAFAALSGYAAADLVGRNTRLFHGPRTEVLAPGVDAATAAKRLLAGESWLYRQDGSVFHGCWKFTPFLPGVLLAVYRDASETQRLQEALLHSQQLDTVGQLTGGVAHEFNNLLSVINGYCEILAGKLAGAPAAARSDLAEIHRAGLKAATIARQILEFSRRQENEPRVVNVNTLIREIAEIVRRSMGEAVQVELRLASDLGNTRIDPTRFQQVLLNLCFNARDAMPNGGKLTVRTSNFAPPAEAGADRSVGCVRIEVTDTGTGIDEATRRRLFEPFFTTKPHGTGLGLSTALTIIRQAEGRLEVHSRPGAGTTFDILLPETPEPEHPASANLGTLPSTRGTEQLWLVESDDVVRKMVSGILAVDGYRVREFTRLDAALAVAAGEPAPDLVLMDCGAPEAGRLARHLLGHNARLKVLAVSVTPPAAVLPELPARAMGHLPKPFALSALLRAVRSLLDGRGR